MVTDPSETYKVITANLLLSGTIVYLVSGDDALEWSAEIGAATVFPQAEITAVLTRAGEDARVVAAYAAEIAGRRAPISARERIRAEGPTIKYGADATVPEDPDFSI